MLSSLTWAPVVGDEVRSTAEPSPPTPVFPGKSPALGRLQAFERSLGRFAERPGDTADAELHAAEDPGDEESALEVVAPEELEEKSARVPDFPVVLRPLDERPRDVAAAEGPAVVVRFPVLAPRGLHGVEDVLLRRRREGDGEEARPLDGRLEGRGAGDPHASNLAGAAGEWACMRRATIPPAAVAALLAFLLAHRGEAAGPPCGTLAQLRSRLAGAPDDAARTTAEAEFSACAARHGTPLLSDGSAPGRVRALFAFRSPAEKVFLAGDMSGWSTSAQPLERLTGTDLHVLEMDVPDGARLDYKLVVSGTEWTLDPWNPKTMTGGYGPNSELRTPAYVPPAGVEPGPGTVKGAWEELKVESRAMGGARSAFVWSSAPAGATGPYPVLYLLDGTDYRDFAKAHVVVGNLVGAGRLPPVVLVLVPPVDRRAEYDDDRSAPGGRGTDRPQRREATAIAPTHAAFTRFLVDELVPAVEARWPVRRDAAGRGVMGASLGGFAALSITARRPGTFGRCGAQSTGGGDGGGFEALLADLGRLPAGSLRVHLDAGTFEALFHGFDLLSLTRHLRAELSRRQVVQYREVPEGHSWGSWRARLADALTFFWGDESRAQPLSARPLAAPPSGAARFAGEPVSLDVKDAELGDVVRRLTEGRGLSVVAPPSFRGTVTASLRDVPWDQALDLVLAGNGWAFLREGTVIRVVRRDDPGR